jgi:hypothetical protein
VGNTVGISKQSAHFAKKWRPKIRIVGVPKLQQSFLKSCLYIDEFVI